MLWIKYFPGSAPMQCQSLTVIFAEYSIFSTSALYRTFLPLPLGFSYPIVLLCLQLTLMLLSPQYPGVQLTNRIMVTDTEAVNPPSNHLAQILASSYSSLGMAKLTKATQKHLAPMPTVDGGWVNSHYSHHKCYLLQAQTAKSKSVLPLPCFEGENLWKAPIWQGTGLIPESNSGWNQMPGLHPGHFPVLQLEHTLK